MTERLYYEDAYLVSFDARVTRCEAVVGGYAVWLDRSAFYPTSGGQPHDLGRLGDANVLDVRVEDGDVLHLTDSRQAVGARVTCHIDWARRLDHMQQHAADHLLAGALYERYGAFTIGLHLGADDATIDVTFPDGRERLTPEEAAELERLVNERIQADLPIRCFFPTPEEMARLPLRKEPTVNTHIRVVLMGDLECVACGGTHPSTTGQLGYFKLLSVTPSKGNARFAFVAGQRAVRYAQRCSNAANRAAALLSTSIDALPDALSHTLARLKDAQYRLRKEKLANALARADALIEAAAQTRHGRVVSGIFPDLDADALRELAGRLIESDDVIALLAGGDDARAPLVFARSKRLQLDMGALLREAAGHADGKGGGKPDFAQGAAVGQVALDYARSRLSA